ncbi:MAG: hypothetical protein ACKO91_18635 [Acidimicrobiales bacterium]
MRKTTTWLATLAVVLAACGGETSSLQGSTEETARPAVDGPVGTAPSPLPDVEVLDVATGRPVRLATFVPADKPTLVWFWAPH